MLLFSLMFFACKDGASTDDTGPATSSDDTALVDDTAAPVDGDGDGFVAGDDCDDSDATVNPDAAEDCDGVDDDCDESVDEGVLEVFYPDADGDGFGDGDAPTELCEVTKGYTTDGTDCQDTSAAVFPGGVEVCNGIDDDCDDLVDDADDGLDADSATTWYLDDDGDGFGQTHTGWLTCTVPQGYATAPDDCDDTDEAVHPDAFEVCDELDNDCDALVDDDDDTLDTKSATSWFADTDGDGYGYEGTSLLACEAPSGFVEDDTDCDDEDGEVHPAQAEVCNNLDDDCDTLVDDEDGSLDASTTSDWYVDVDGDGYGTGTKALSGCDVGTGYASVAGDCDDDDVTVSPSASEVCDDVDNDCDGLVDDDDDTVDATTGITVYVDADGDGYGTDASVTYACDETSGLSRTGGDCDDGDGDVNPGVQETCSGVDDDCDGLVDSDDDSLDVGSMSDWHDDADSDGYGDPEVFTEACDAPSGTVADGTDCDDTDSSVNPGATEVDGDGTDQDCDGSDASYTVDDLAVGDLVVTEILADPFVVADDDGEWFEIYVDFSDGHVDLSGLVVSDDATSTETFEVTRSLIATAGDYVVFGTSTDTSVNGGADVDYDWGNTGLFSLANSSADGLSIEAPDGTILDEVAWNDGAMPDEEGAAMNLDPDFYDPTDNDDASSWCEAQDSMSGGDRGSPGLANAECE